MSAFKAPFAKVNFILLCINFLFLFLGTYFLAGYWAKKAIFVAIFVSMWLEIGAFMRFYWPITLLVGAILVFSIIGLPNTSGAKILELKVTFWTLVIWSAVMYLPVVYIQLLIFSGS